MITLSVDLRVRSGHVEPFLTAVEAIAARTFADEPGCVYFDVARDVADGLHFVLFEVYLDQAAVETHRATPHFADWVAAVDEHLEPGGRTRTTGVRLHHHGSEAQA
jgi:autoinducer 2-degrading protein